MQLNHIITLQQKLFQKLFQSTNSECLERFNHSLGVSKKAVELVLEHKLDVDLEKASIAGLIHDYAKFEKMETYQKIVEKYQLNINILDESFSILHALLGVYVIQEELQIDDVEILEAIKYHTTGYHKMSKLAEVIYLADVVEENRKEENIKFLREVATLDYQKAIALHAKFTINKLKQENKHIHTYTMDMFEAYKQYL